MQKNYKKTHHFCDSKTHSNATNIIKLATTSLIPVDFQIVTAIINNSTQMQMSKVSSQGIIKVFFNEIKLSKEKRIFFTDNDTDVIINGSEIKHDK